MNDDLISRSEAIEVIRSMTISLGGAEIFHPEAKKSVLGALDDLAGVDVEPVRHGCWIESDDPNRFDRLPFEMTVAICSNCKTDMIVGMYDEYCPRCGAKKDGEPVLRKRDHARWVSEVKKARGAD